MKRVIWWIRRDFRLQDNSALAAALVDADEVIPVFIFDPVLLASNRVKGPRIAWMRDGLAALDSSLRELGASLTIRQGKAIKELQALCKATHATGVYFNRDYSPYATRRDQLVLAMLEAEGIAVKSFKDLVIHEASEVASGQGKPYEVYTPFRKAWQALPKPALLPSEQPFNKLRAAPEGVSLPLPTLQDLKGEALTEPIAIPGEHEAQHQLEAFTAGPIYRYGEQRNTPAIHGSAIISPYLRWGMISPRQCYWTAIHALESAPDAASRASVEVWIAELAWREFFYQVLARNPHSVRQNFRPAYDAVAWENRFDWLKAWAEGCTGFPIVDAAMRQLNATGWMHNRARLIVASFLCKDLLIDWRHGELVFMRRLLDADVASNVGNWQWSAGTGTDAAPYFRIFNPTSQGEKFDLQGEYVRRWIPELARVPDAFVHQPHLMSREQQIRSGCIIGQHYPAPIVDHGVQRERALQMYAASKART